MGPEAAMPSLARRLESASKLLSSLHDAYAALAVGVGFPQYIWHHVRIHAINLSRRSQKMCHKGAACRFFWHLLRNISGALHFCLSSCARPDINANTRTSPEGKKNAFLEEFCRKISID